jgi:hypothetical protein
MKTNATLPPRRLIQAGVTLFEVIAALAVGAVITAGVTSIVNDSLDDTKAQQAASYQAKVSEAAASYIKVNYQTLQALGSTTKTVTMTDLVSGNFLDPSTATTNSYGQEPCLMVRVTTVAGQLLPQALLITQKKTGSSAIPGKQLAYAASLSPNGGSLALEDDPASTTTPKGKQVSAKGAYSNWKIVLKDSNNALKNFNGTSCTIDPGHLATLVTWGAAGTGAGAPTGTSDFLYRNAVAGVPSANKMGTTLDMGGNDITNVKNLTVTGALNISGALNTTGTLSASAMTLAENSVGGSCMPEGSYARAASSPQYNNPANAPMLVCASGKWASYNDNFLYRKQVPGSSDANSMMTTLDMNSNDINYVRSISLDGSSGGGINAPQGYGVFSNLSSRYLRLHAPATGTGALPTTYIGLSCNGYGGYIGTSYTGAYASDMDGSLIYCNQVDSTHAVWKAATPKVLTPKFRTHETNNTNYSCGSVLTSGANASSDMYQDNTGSNCLLGGKAGGSRSSDNKYLTDVCNWTEKVVYGAVHCSSGDYVSVSRKIIDSSGNEGWEGQCSDGTNARPWIWMQITCMSMSDQ